MEKQNKIFFIHIQHDNLDKKSWGSLKNLLELTVSFVSLQDTNIKINIQ